MTDKKWYLARDFKNKKLGQELTKELAEKIMSYRDEYYNYFIGRYMEGLSTLFSYDMNDLAFDKMRLEISLRCGYGVAFGKNSEGMDVMLGTVTDNYGFGMQPGTLNSLITRRRYTSKDISFIIPKEYRPKELLLEITSDDNAKTGDFVVFHNKPIYLTNDYDMIRHYAEILAEIEASRYSLIMQSKVTTVLTGEVGDETINQMVSALYNGSPYLKVSNTFDPEENILKLGDGQIANTLKELNEQKQNVIAELNSLFGINVLAVSKESGVTQSEANGNLGYVNMNANIFLETRRLALNLYNDRFGTDYKVGFDDTVVNTVDDKADKSGDDTDENNDNSGGDSENGGVS